MDYSVRLQFRKLAKLLEAQANVAGGTGHSSTTGSLRELIIQNFLSPHLPKSLDIRSGIIIDSKGARSRQQDCIIVDTSHPIISVGSDKEAVLIAESIVATIEIKSFLDSAELRKALDSIAQTRALFRNGEQTYIKGSSHIRLPKSNPILTYIFAFDGMHLETITTKTREFAENLNDSGISPEVICVLPKGAIFRSAFMPVVKGNQVTLPKFTNVTMTGRHLTKDALYAFYQRLIDDVIPLRMTNWDIDAYYNEQDLE